MGHKSLLVTQTLHSLGSGTIDAAASAAPEA